MYMLSCAIARMEPNPNGGDDVFFLTEFTQMDFKGYVPKKLMNMVMAAMAKGTVGPMYEKLKTL